MLLRTLPIVCICSCFYLQGQIISQFDFDSNPVTTATVGPDASSISSSATSAAGGVGGTNGLNAGLPKMDIDMVIPGSPTFDVPGIDVSFDFQRDENGGRFFERGNSLRMNGISNLSVSYRVDNGMGGFNTVNSGNIYSLPNDNTFRNYRFVYTPCDGVGMVMVDNVVIWSNDGPDNRDMYWTGSGDVMFGNGMDGTGFNRTMVDNLIVGEVTCSPLPVDFLTVSAEKKEQERLVNVSWITESEQNNSHFVVERSKGLNEWDSLTMIEGAGYSTNSNTYLYTDLNPYIGISYYRIKQVDFDGSHTYSNVVSVKVSREEIIAVPNPTSGTFVLKYPDQKTNEEKEISIYNTYGKCIKRFKANGNNSIVDLSNEAEGVYYVIFGEQKLKLVKL